ncbi:uncharacterized protein E0L32_003144 [Thyridium curvatum]|uniref:NACHT-NTPase and P-loop NTPases N-terminal domain-containing protein n=1 Tax=Thyridium curvatum TaxID=1093900 RepID=A0A507BK84_9PEZI|nr:uncharacterized protein E0L32_003144 [Thyridium curvatum]TPX17501.1 hypothetical protein E0L32_003144 [Thyridium curvatum]
MDIVGVAAASIEILSKIIEIVSRSRRAFSRTKNGPRYLDSVRAQAQTLTSILQGLFQGPDIEPHLHHPAVGKTIELVKDTAKKLKNAATVLEESQSKPAFIRFFNEFWKGDDQIERFDKMQSELSQALVILITAMVAAKADGTSVVQINLRLARQVDACFDTNQEVKYARRIIDLVEAQGKRVGETDWYEVKQEDLDNVLKKSSPSNWTIRVIKDAKVSEWGFVSADVGDEGKGAPLINEVVATNIDVSGDGRVIVGTLSYETNRDMEMLRSGLKTLQGDKGYAKDMIADLRKGKK